MFSKFNTGIRNTTPNEKISFTELVQMIKDNPNKEKISQIRELRAIGDKSYKDIKKNLPCVTVNAVLNERRLGTATEFKKNFIEGSGYVYLDFDCSSLREATELKDLLVTRYGDKVAMVCFSSTMGGVSVLVKYNGFTITSKEDFRRVRNHIIEHHFSNLKEKIDEQTKSLGQIWFISFDEKVFVNDKSVIDLPTNMDFIYDEDWGNLKEENVKINVIGEERVEFTLDFTLLPDTKDFLNDINWCTEVEVENNLLDVKEIDYYKLYIPKTIRDRKKRKTYIRIFTTFLQLNPDRSIYDAVALLKYINETRTEGHGMPVNGFIIFISGLVNDYQSGKLKATPEKKYVHFNKNSTLNRHEKSVISNKLNAKLRANETIMKILQAKQQLIGEGKEVRKSTVNKCTGLSRPTIDKYWNCSLTDLNNIYQLITDLEKKYS